MALEIGDTVKVWKFVYDTEYSAEGKIEALQTDCVHGQSVKVAGDWFAVENDLTHSFELLAVANPATAAQKEYLMKLGYDGDFGSLDLMTKREASMAIDELKNN